MVITAHWHLGKGQPRPGAAQPFPSLKAETACAWHLHWLACQPLTKDRDKDKSLAWAQAKQASQVSPGRDEGRADAENTWLTQAAGSSLRSARAAWESLERPVGPIKVVLLAGEACLHTSRGPLGGRGHVSGRVWLIMGGDRVGGRGYEDGCGYKDSRDH